MESSRRNRGRFDSNWETAKGMFAIAPAVVAGLSGAPRIYVLILGIAGGAIALAWFGFVTWHSLAAWSRHGDRMYRMVTRKYLSKEYRDD